jgi:nucleotide-binding universal stress UspA family protein
MPGITVGIDGSDSAKRALAWAVKEAAIRHCDLTAITVNEVAASYWTGNPITLPVDEKMEEEAGQAAEKAAAEAVSQLGAAQPASVTVRAVSGFTAQELIGASRDSDLLVIGARGGGGFHPLALGSISSQVVHHAHCPVVVVPAPAR